MSSGSRRLAGEGVVIVLSILAAFALDSWWAQRVERRALLQDLRGIRDEVAKSLGETEGGGLRERFAGQIRVSSGARALAEALGAASEGAAVTVPDSLLVLSVIAMTIDPRSAAVESFVASGRLGEIEDTDLRWQLAGWPQSIEDALEDERSAARLVQDRIEPLIEASLSTAEYERIRLGAPDYFLGWKEGLEVRVRSSAALRNALLTRMSRTQLAAREIRQLIDRTEELIVSLDGYLEAHR